MSVSYGADSALISGTTSATISSMPAGSAGDLLIVLCGSNHATDDTAIPTIDDGTYTQLFTYVSTGGGAQGAGSGNRRVTAWYKTRGASETGPTVSLTGGDVMGINAWNFTKTLSNAFSLAYTTGEDSSDDTSLSVTGAGGLDVQTGDLILFGHVSNDSVTVTSEALSITGATVGAVTEQLDSGTTTGNDIRVSASTASITAGSSNTAPTYTATLSAASQAAGFFVRISDRSLFLGGALGTATETDTAQPIGGGDHIVALGTATETGTAQPITGSLVARPFLDEPPIYTKGHGTVGLSVRVGPGHVTPLVRDVSFRKEAVGGVRAISVKVARPLDYTESDMGLYQSVYVYNTTTGECIAEGRISDQGRTADGDGASWLLTAFGPAAAVDNITTPYYAIDSALSRWDYPSSVTGPACHAEYSEYSPSVSGIKMYFDSGQSGSSTVKADAVYRAMYRAGRRVARILAHYQSSVVSGTYDVALAALPGESTNATETVASTGLNSTGDYSISAKLGDADFTSADYEAHLRFGFSSGTGTTSSAMAIWWYAATVRAVLCDKDGTDIETGYTNDYVLAHEVVADLLGRHLPAFNATVSTIDTTSTFQITQFAYPDGVTPSKVLADLMALEPAYRWYTKPTPYLGSTSMLEAPTTGYQFIWEAWPSKVRYQLSIQDGGTFPTTAQDIYNKVLVRWVDSAGLPRTNTRTAANTILDAAGVTRQALIDLGTQTGTSLQADRVGDNFLADHAVPSNAGTLTVNRPIYDNKFGRLVQPWEIEPGELVRILGVGASYDALSETDRDGSSVFRIHSMEYTASSNTARLELDSDSRTMANAIVALLRR